VAFFKSDGKLPEELGHILEIGYEGTIGETQHRVHTHPGHKPGYRLFLTFKNFAGGRLRLNSLPMITNSFVNDF
jgi:hypothetical protein